ncbi:hypothetical protein CCMSSC00406_0007372 [Pleurotus cornucopiae]|uniref:Uncharacterized protein n=1 Tax=Pleurotus cornucopiae TaxID=5321 RepID=A0ACB7ISJ0_PLECO|nr:hypothetical protein CCMSSC00406_0007372 [Pleurotus cornucopiae]
MNSTLSTISVPSKQYPGSFPVVYDHGRSSTQPQNSVRNAKANPIEEWEKGGFGPRLVAPLRMSTGIRTLTADPVSLYTVCRKVRALLNKLAVATFDSISDQIIEWANMSRTETDARTLKQIIQLVYGAMDEDEWLVEMLARLCRKMMEQISPEVQDVSVTVQGWPVTGGPLFRKYLLNRCQEDFERGWVSMEAAATSKTLSDKSVTANAKEAESLDEVAFYSEKYYATQKARHQGLGLIMFMGELFKLQMLTERIMHECVKKLLGNVDNPEEEEIEGLCKLLSTVGKLLDMPKARAHIDVYFRRMNDLMKSLIVSSRMQFMLQDIIELRQRRWVSRSSATVPTTQVFHELSSKIFSQINENFNEPLGLRNSDAAEKYFSILPPSHHEDLVHALVLKAIESREADANLIASLFARAVSKNLCTRTAFEQGFSRVAQSLEDIVIDAPKAWDFLDTMAKGAGLTEESQRWTMSVNANRTPFSVTRSAVDGSIRSASTNVNIDPAEEVRQIYSLPLMFGHLIRDDGSGIHDNKEIISKNIAKDAPSARGITLLTGVSRSGSTPSGSPAFTAPQQEVDDTVNAMQHDSHNAVPSNMPQLYSGQIEEYRAREASWSKEVEFLRRQVAIWQELHKQSEEKRKDVTIRRHLVDQSDTSLPSEFPQLQEACDAF